MENEFGFHPLEVNASLARAIRTSPRVLLKVFGVIVALGLVLSVVHQGFALVARMMKMDFLVLVFIVVKLLLDGLALRLIFGYLMRTVVAPQEGQPNLKIAAKTAVSSWGTSMMLVFWLQIFTGFPLVILQSSDFSAIWKLIGALFFILMIAIVPIAYYMHALSRLPAFGLILIIFQMIFRNRILNLVVALILSQLVFVCVLGGAVFGAGILWMMPAVQNLLAESPFILPLVFLAACVILIFILIVYSTYILNLIHSVFRWPIDPEGVKLVDVSVTQG